MTHDAKDDAAHLGRLWDELVTGSPGDIEAYPELLEMIGNFEKLAVTPPPPPDLAARTWERITGAPLSLAPYVAAGTMALNGHRMHGVTAAPVRSARRVAFAELVRQLAIATMAGMCGGFVTGIWARLMMRLSGFLTVDRNRGLLTENDAVVGHITLEGTLAIGITGALMGVIGGMLYVAIRRWLPGNIWQRSAAFGVLLLAVFGFVVMDRSNPDYRLFGPAWMNVGTFSLAYIVFGVVTGTMAEWLDRRMPRFGATGRSRPRSVALAGVFSPFAVIGLIVTVLASLGFAGLTGLLFVALIVVARLPIARLMRGPRLAAWLPRPEFAAYAAVAVPSLIGFTLTMRAIVDIVGG